MHTWMDAYMRQFSTDDEVVMQGISIKQEHTGYVTAIARELAQHLNLGRDDGAFSRRWPFSPVQHL